MARSIPWMGYAGLVLLGIGAASCSVEKIIENEIRRRVPDAGEVPAPGPGDVTQDPFEINSIQPNRGLTSGGTSVTVVGLGFTQDMAVTIGDVLLAPDAVEYINPNRIRFNTPPHAPGVVGIAVERGAAREVLEQAFTYYNPVELHAVDPNKGPTDGGRQVTVTGAGFVTGTTVRFGSGGTPINAIVIDSQTLVVESPPLPVGSYSVTVSNLNGTASLAGAFRAFAPIRLREVLPFAAPLGGSTSVTGYGQGFFPQTTLYFGALGVPGTSNTAQTQVSAVLEPLLAPPEEPLAEGIIDITAQNEDGADTLAGAFALYDETDDTPRIIGYWPDAGDPAGGGTVRFVGVGLDDSEVTVEFGDEEGACTVLDGHMLECQAPASPGGAEGTVDIRLYNDVLDVTFADGFEYINLDIELLDPVAGSIAGQTWVQIFGKGFGPDTKVYFDDRLAPVIEFQDSSTVWAWTPRRNETGSVDVRVETRSLNVNRVDAYTYTDPLDATYFTHGGPIEAAVNVTVVNGRTGQPLADAFVMLDAYHDPAHFYTGGFTNNRGQITLSGPTITPPVDVHGAKIGFGGDSVFGADAQNITLALLPAPEPPPTPLPNCPEGDAPSFPPQGSPLLRGTVSRIKDEFNTGNDVVLVTTSFINFSVALPNPGSKNQMVSQGPYELFSRTGEMVVIALAGMPSSDGFLNVHAMGFYPFLFTQASSTTVCESDGQCLVDEQCVDVGAQNNYCLRVYDDIDIVIDTPLNQPLEIRFEDPPLGLPGTPSYAPPRRAFARVWYDFASMGVFSMGQTAAMDTATLYLPMPYQMPPALSSSPFHVLGQINSVDPNAGSTWLEVRSFNQLDTREPVVLAPMLQAVRETAPVLGSFVGGQANGLATPLHLERLPYDSAAPLPQYTQHIIYDVINQPLCLHPVFGVQSRMEIVYHWTGLSPGYDPHSTLPLLPATMANAALAPEMAFGWWMLGTYIPGGADYNNLPRTIGQQWRSRTGRSTYFFTMPAP